VTLGTVAGALGAVTASLPANTGTIAEINLAQTWTATQTYTGASPQEILGITGSIVGGIQFLNATSGSITLAPAAGALGSATATLPANTGTIAELNLAQSWSAVQTFAAGDISLTGATTGCATFTGTILSSTGVACGSGGGNATGPYTVGTAITATGTIGAVNTTYCVNPTVAIVLTLPAGPATGARIVLKDCTGLMTPTVTATIQGSAGNVDGQANFVMNTAYQSNAFWYSGSQWQVE